MKGLILYLIIYFPYLVMIILFMLANLRSPYLKGNCSVLKVVSIKDNNTLIGNYIETTIYYEYEEILDKNNHNISLMNKFFYCNNCNITLENEKYIQEYGDISKKYLCYNKDNIIYISDPESRLQILINKFSLACLISFILLLIILCIITYQNHKISEFYDFEMDVFVN